ncbi:MAG: glycosyl transferase [Leptolyngbya foveolarum]|uniref:Glycosyl transferase n=1 Tax=Leptolyngbya foveolarum TaxID=47253 RepID=A0A2W4VK67_9CYAN|nr:MAG: glycosyl transferase [Leptolyngbya foveolarum]
MCPSFFHKPSSVSADKFDKLSTTTSLQGLAPLFHWLFPDRLATDFTVVIPTYNGGDRLGTLLDRLRHQINVEDISWEIIVVDNNSTDHTREVVQHYQTHPQIDWPDRISLRYEFEPQQGAGFARNLGVRTARSSLIGFLDDDNLPWINWIRAAYKFAQQHPQVGVFGSRIRGKFSTPVPANFNRIAALLALTDRGPHPIPYKPEAKILPPGAGLVVRRQAWLENIPERRSLAEKFGEREAGEDLEMVLYIQQAGWEVWYNARMWMHHVIPENRLTKTYLVKLCKGIGLSRYHTRMLSFAPRQRPFVLLPYVLNDIRKIVLHVAREREKVVTDTVSASEMMLYLASLVSPLYSRYRIGKRRMLEGGSGKSSDS